MVDEGADDDDDGAARRRRHGGRKDGTGGAAEAWRARERGAKEATVQLLLLLQ